MSDAAPARTRRQYQAPAERPPFESAQFLIEPAGVWRRQIDNDHGEPVLLVVSARNGPSMLPRRLAAFYDVHSGERLLELRPDRSETGAHVLLDPGGTRLARFRLHLPYGRWTAHDGEGRLLASASGYPRVAAAALLGRGRWIRTLVLTAGSAVVGVLVRRSPEFDGHDLVDLSYDTGGLLDRRVALALSLLAG